MTRKSVPYKGEKYHYYYCPTTKKRGCENAPMLKESDLAECILESVKAQVANVASLEAIIAASDSQQILNALTAQYMEQIADNERQIEKIGGFKATLYENMVGGVISKEEYKSLKDDYVTNENRLREAIAAIQEQLDDVIAGKSECLKWTEHFKRFENLAEIDRRTVVSLIQSIRIVSKTELQITFNYQSEYEIALALLGKEAA